MSYLSTNAYKLTSTIKHCFIYTYIYIYIIKTHNPYNFNQLMSSITSPNSKNTKKRSAAKADLFDREDINVSNQIGDKSKRNKTKKRRINKKKK